MSLVVEPNHDHVLYAASELAGVWKSTTGATWVAGPNGHTTASSMQWSGGQLSAAEIAAGVAKISD